MTEPSLCTDQLRLGYERAPGYRARRELQRLNSRVRNGIVLPFEEVSLEEVVRREAGEVRTRSYPRRAGTEILK